MFVLLNLVTNDLDACKIVLINSFLENFQLDQVYTNYDNFVSSFKHAALTSKLGVDFEQVKDLWGELMQ